MSKPLLILISGPPCTGKTTLGKRIAEELHFPFVHKDGIKELLFETLGWSDRAWSRRLGIASYELLYYFMEIQLRAERSLIVESNFSALSTAKFLEFKEKYNYEPFQIQCVTNGAVLFERFQRRAESGERHPGHVDHLSYDEFQAVLLKGRGDVIEIGGIVYEVDTTDFGAIDYEKLLMAISSFAKQIT